KGKLVLQVMSETTGMVNFDLNYLTSGATWTPFYDLRVENVKSPIDMTYKAQIVQNTGIDWKQTKLTLSSGNPNQNNQAPLLHTWFVDYMNDNYYLQNPTKDLRANVIQGYASGVQLEEAELKKKSTVTDYTTIVENQLNVSFEIDVLYDI